MKRTILGLIATGILFVNASSVNAGPGAPPHHGHHRPVDYLPATAAHLVVEGVKYWLSDGMYYRKSGKQYIVVEAPEGVRLRHLPDGSVVVKHNGKQYFRHAGVYYRWVPASHEYEVVIPEVSRQASLPLGSVLEKLPNGANATLFNGVQYFTFNGQFFIQTERSGKTVYVVVGIDAG